MPSLQERMETAQAEFEQKSETTEPETPPVAETPPEATTEATEEPELILGKFKDQDSLAKSYQELERRIGQRDELANLGQMMVEHEAEFMEFLSSKQKPAQPKIEPGPPATDSDIPEYDPNWSEMTAEEMTPQDKAKLAKYNRWFINQTRNLVHNKELRELVKDPQGYLAKTLQPVVGTIQKTQEQLQAERQQERLTEQVHATLEPIAKELFKAGTIDWQNTTELGAKVAEIYQSDPDLAKANPVSWLQKSIRLAKAELPKPNEVRKPAPASKRQAAVAPPPQDAANLQEEADKLAKQGWSLAAIQTHLMKKFYGATE